MPRIEKKKKIAYNRKEVLESELPMKLLSFDTSNKTLSLALLDGNQLVADFTLNIQKNHSISLMPVIDFLMDQLGWQPADLERIVVAQGPGSYTGLRVAVATAKTLAYTLGIDLVGVSSLYALTEDEPGLVVPLINARRNTAYVGFYNNGRAVQPDRHDDFSVVLDRLEGQTSLTFVGEVAAFADQIRERFPEAAIKETLPSAYRIGLLGQELPAVDAHSFVPAYLKKVEAEENWLKTNAQGDLDTYIKRV